MNNEEYVKRIQDGEKELLGQLWEKNENLIYYIAKKYSAIAEVEDLVQESYFGFVYAVDNYDPNVSTFSAFLFQNVRYTILRYIDKNRNIGVSIGMKGKIRQFQRVKRRFYAIYGTEPNIAYIAYKMGISLAKALEIEDYATNTKMLYLDSPIAEAESTLKDIIPGNESVEDTIIDDLDRKKLCEVIVSDIKRLPGKQSEVVYRHFINGESFTQIATDLNVAPQTVSSTSQRALRNLRIRIPDHPEVKAYINEMKAYSIAYRNNGFRRTRTSSTEKAVLLLCGEY